MVSSADIIVNIARRDTYTPDVQRDIDSNFENLKEIVAPLDAGAGVNGTIDTAASQIITVVNGIITNIT